MNTNDMDRYYWRTGQRWSSDCRSLREVRGEFRLPSRIVWCLLFAFIVTIAMLIKVNL
jgi:hypothetical protein